MEEIIAQLERISSITSITLSLIDETGQLLFSSPDSGMDIVKNSAGMEVIDVFQMCNLDPMHPLICFIDPGFLLGVIEVTDHRYVLIGLVSPYIHTRSEVLKTVCEVIHPAYLEQFCDRILQQPLISLEKMKDLICVLTRLFGSEVPYENILYVDQASSHKLSESFLDSLLFESHETADYHVPQDFEQAICAAVEAGDRSMLERALFSPVQGKIGRMSANELRQSKYSFICLATLVSRSAIQGGLDSETAFSLSDLYCQRADLLTEISKIQNLTFTMLVDFCSKVHENSKHPAVSPVVDKCLRYISIHLHEPITIDLLSQHCGLCGRSLSIHFKKEMNMGITEYIHREKLREAKYLLRHTEHSLADVAAYLNYPSQSYFTQIFKKLTDMTPQQYRNVRK